MGTNRRYADKIDRQMQRRAREVEMRPRFESLPPELSDIEDDKPMSAPRPVPVSAWVGVTSGKIRVDGIAAEWNRKAARVVWTDVEGNENSVWVYLGAVTRR